MRVCGEHGTNSNVCDDHGCFGPPKVTLEQRIAALEKQVETLLTFLFTHRHGYRWEPVAKDGKRFSLDLKPEDYDRLGVELEKINEAERKAWITPPVGTRLESHRRFVPDYGSEGEY